MMIMRYPRLVARVSTDCLGEICTDIIDKNNGNLTVASDVDEDYENLIINSAEMYDVLSSIENDDNKIPPFLWERIQKVLTKVTIEG